jgi:Fe-S-cluster containining protein
MEGCISCGACCHHLQIQANALDVRREPRIAEVAQSIGNGIWQLIPLFDDRRGFRFYCPFLHSWGCEIYATRPFACSSFKRGSEECLSVRNCANRGSPRKPSPCPTMSDVLR